MAKKNRQEAKGAREHTESSLAPLASWRFYIRSITQQMIKIWIAFRQEKKDGGHNQEPTPDSL
jgi:hypothetical protein